MYNYNFICVTVITVVVKIDRQEVIFKKTFNNFLTQVNTNKQVF